jgi:hypothetical protein
MTETTIEPATETLGVLTTLIITLLAPTFLGVCHGDIGLARSAAIETVNGYRARTRPDLIAAAQIIDFSLAALSSLSLSMAGDVSASMALRLRANANACNRAAEQNRRALAKSQANDVSAQHQPVDEAEIPASPAEYAASSEPDVFLPAAAEQLLAEESRARLHPKTAILPAPPSAPATARASTERRHQDMWAIAMVKEASEISAGVANLPPAERQEAVMRAGLMGSTAHDLVYGAQVARLDPGALGHIPRQNAGRNQVPPPA